MDSGRLCRRALVDKAVDTALAPYFEALEERAADAGWYAGFKLTRQGTDLENALGTGSPAAPGADAAVGQAADRGETETG